MEKANSMHDAVMEAQKREEASKGVELPDTAQESPLHLAVRAQDLVACEALLQKGAQPNVLSSAGFTPLHYAIDAKNLAICACLLQAGALFSYAPETRDPAYLTPFQYASRKRWLEGVRFFLATQGGDPCAAPIWQGSQK